MCACHSTGECTGQVAGVFSLFTIWERLEIELMASEASHFTGTGPESECDISVKTSRKHRLHVEGIGGRRTVTEFSMWGREV